MGPSRADCMPSAPAGAPGFRLRMLAVPLLVVAGAQLLALLLTGSGIPCALRALTGIPCPGCGLTRGCVAMLQGDLAGGMSHHALAPLAVLATAMALAGAVLPGSLRARAAGWLMGSGGRALSAVLLSLLIVYWLFRLASGWRG